MYSNSTTHYNLPQYEANDVPSILGDLNGAYSIIDGAIYAAADEASEATATAALAKTTADTAIANVAGAQADATQALADAATADGKAVAAQTDATQALGDANDAMTAATNAQTDATNALTAATNAQTTASSALSAASDATTAAGNAATAASAAQNTANSAVSAASAAQSDATQALADASTADGKAVAAQSDATDALTLLGNTTLPTVAQTVTGAITEIAAFSPSVTATGNNYGAALDSLFTQIDPTKLTPKSVIFQHDGSGQGSIYRLDMKLTSQYDFVKISNTLTYIRSYVLSIKQTSSAVRAEITSNATTFTDITNDSAANITFDLYY